MGSILIGILLLLIYLFNQNPLSTNGFSENNERSKLILSLVNKGSFNIKIEEVQVNDKISSNTQLVISYSGQLASSGGIYTDPLAKFSEIQNSTIHPELSAHEAKEAYSSETNTKPISYGLSVINNEKVNFIKIKYKYLGISHVKEINLDRWFE